MSTSMHEYLAQEYGNGGAALREKTAGLDLLQKLASEMNVDLDKLTPEQQAELAAQAEEAAQEEAAGGGEGGEAGAAAGDPDGGAAAMGDPPTEEEVETITKMAADANVDINTLSEEQLQGILSQLRESRGQAAGGEGTELSPEEQIAKEAQDQKDTADYLGRVMAHSMVQELRHINEKLAMENDPDWAGGEASKQTKSEKLKEMLGKAKDKTVAGARAAGGAITGLHGRSGLKGKDLAKAIAFGGGAGSSKGRIAATVASRLGIAGAAAGAAHAMRRKEAAEGYEALQQKLAEQQFDAAIEEAAQERAVEILKANGYQVE